MNISNEYNFWKVNVIMNTSGLLQRKWSSCFTFFANDLKCIHDSMNRPKIEFIAYIYILLYSTKKKRTTTIFPLSSPLNTKMLIVMKYSFLIKSY